MKGQGNGGAGTGGRGLGGNLECIRLVRSMAERLEVRTFRQMLVVQILMFVFTTYHNMTSVRLSLR